MTEAELRQESSNGQHAPMDPAAQQHWFKRHLQRMVDVARQMRIVAKPETPDRTAFIEALMMRAGFGELMDSLNKSPAFQAFVGAHEKRRREIVRALRDAVVPEGVARNVIRLQAQLEELDSMLEFTLEAMADGELARAKLDEVRTEIQNEEHEDHG